jgi:putative intracellular protease/amidase
MSLPSYNSKSKPKDEGQYQRTIRVGILAEEPLGWGSGKHFFPIILDKYSWKRGEITYTFSVNFVYDDDILKGELIPSAYDVLLVPGGGVGDGLAVMKGFTFLPHVKKWKEGIALFIQNGGGYVGICGGTALITDLKTKDGTYRTFLERQYHKSSLGVSCVSHYYPHLAFPLLYPFQKQHPENIGAIGYVFSFAPGVTIDGARPYAGGASIDFQLRKDNPLFSDVGNENQRIRWWGGPSLIVPTTPDRDVKVLATYPSKDVSNDDALRIHAWRYVGGLHGLLRGFFKALRLLKKEHVSLNHLFLYAFYLAGKWELTDKTIMLDQANKPSITAEVYPNEHKGRILLCTAHPEYLAWWNGHIKERNDSEFPCLGTGLYQWEGITPLSKTGVQELTNTWWMVRRFVAWAAKVPDDHLPPRHEEKLSEEAYAFLAKDIFWDGSLLGQMNNI